MIEIAHREHKTFGNDHQNYARRLTLNEIWYCECTIYMLIVSVQWNSSPTNILLDELKLIFLVNFLMYDIPGFFLFS